MIVGNENQRFYFIFQKKSGNNSGAVVGGDTNTTIGATSATCQTGVTSAQSTVLQNTNIGVDEIASADKISKSNANLDGNSQNGKLGASGAKDPLIQDHKSGEPSKGTFDFQSYHVNIPKPIS